MFSNETDNPVIKLIKKLMYLKKNCKINSNYETKISLVENKFFTKNIYIITNLTSA